MLRVALRRMLWAIPTLFGISLVVFFVTTLIPDPADAQLLSETASSLTDAPGEDAITERRREHFLDLPRFLNPRPEDVRSRAEADVRAIVSGGDAAEGAARELVRLGGAALPYVLPELDNVAPG